MSQVHKVKVYGHVLSVKSARNPEFTHDVARMVDQQMRDIARENKNTTTEQIALLASMNLAGQLLEERRNEASLIQKVAEMRTKVEEELRVAEEKFS